MKRNKYVIKNPTTAKVKRKGLTPLVYHTTDCQVTGWIGEVGRKWLYFYSPSFVSGKNPRGRRQVPLTDKRFMREVV